MTKLILIDYKYELKRLYKYFKEQNFSNFTKTFADKIYRWKNGISNPKYSIITDKIMIGGQPSEKGFCKLKKCGVTLIINLRKEFDYEDLVDLKDIRYLYLPTEDDNLISSENLKKGIYEIKYELNVGGKIFIHCLEGLGRSVTLLAAYFIEEGNTYKIALEKIKKKRPFISPSKAQIKMLKELNKQNPKNT